MAPAMRELCAGTARLSEEGKRQGLPVDQPEDVAYGSQYDLTNDRVIRRLKKEIAAGGIRYLPIATPCASFSRWPVKTGTSSRTEAEPWGQNSTPREREANVLVWNVIGLLETCRRHRVWYTIENPTTSLLWRIPELQPYLMAWTHFDACQYGSEHKKPTTLAGNAP